MEYSIRLQLAKMPAEYTAMYERLRPLLGKADAWKKVKMLYGMERSIRECLIG